MSPILEILRDVAGEQPMPRKETELLRKVDAYYSAVEKAFSRDFAEGLMDAYGAVWSAEADAFFEQGFRMGAGLMLEVLRE